ncbi:fumarylacetoacetate hydrolase family protein [Antarcticimicrobium luteum]|uniref:FAA hydrolase family protein n=1 Tax=Antarcticimicrobium luteum TaxID=2547397 RepID=A0A4R5V1K3_9RHOB|nr:fumarylacetoacetate hydrolase family protein [Antarcticimicrobium luteum]TDK45670.1 FAA hydrolase family protein [Antarcticimicrobium luteum]
MKLARFDDGKIGYVDAEEIVDITVLCGVDAAAWPPVGMPKVIADFAALKPKIEAGLASCTRHRLSDVVLRTPIPWPNKVIAYPVNYHAHGREMQAGYRATQQGFFLKPNSSLSGAGEPVELPDLPGRETHHESELAIIIGREARGVARADWKDYVFGYACLLDMVVRGREERVCRKAYDSFCPVGPWITTADEVATPEELQMKLWVNDELRQSANTRDLVLDIPGMIETASAVMKLYPGDIIATGTPEGVGKVEGGDRIRIRIEQVGEMTVDVIQGHRGQTEVFSKPYEPDIIKQELKP